MNVSVQAFNWVLLCIYGYSFVAYNGIYYTVARSSKNICYHVFYIKPEEIWSGKIDINFNI